MTLPYERLRSLIAGERLLDAIANDETLPSEMRLRAAEICGTYPGVCTLESLLALPVAGLPMDAANAIEAAGRLFQELQFRSGDTPLRPDARFVLRHFPLPGSSIHMATHGTWGGLKAWIRRDGES